MTPQVMQLAAIALAFAAVTLASYALFSLVLGSSDRPSAFLTMFREESGQAWERFSSAGSKAIAAYVVERDWFPGLRARIGKNLRRSGREADSPEEFFGFCVLTGGLATVGALVLIFLATGSLSIVGALVGGFLGYWVPLNLLQQRADRRVMRITRRMPYAVDMAVLAIEAGASFDEALSIMVGDAPEEPLHEEFDQVLRDGQLGVSRRDALHKMAERIGTEDLNSLVMAINMGDELGTPIGQTLRLQADAIRLRRTQRAEKIAGEAGPKMAVPNALIMMANVLLILAPFLHKFGSGGGIF